MIFMWLLNVQYFESKYASSYEDVEMTFKLTNKSKIKVRLKERKID